MATKNRKVGEAMMTMYNPEEDLLTYKRLKQDEKAIQKQINELKEHLIKNYFNQHESYISTGYGITATYGAREVTRFQSALFEENHPALFKDYSKKVIEFRFDVK